METRKKQNPKNVAPKRSLLATLLGAPTSSLADLKSVTPVAQMPSISPWLEITQLQEQWSQVHRFFGILLNALFTERRIVFPLARTSFEKLIAQPNALNRGGVSGTDFKDFRIFLVANNFVRELRAPNEKVMPGLYILAHQDLMARLLLQIGSPSIIDIEAKAIAEWDAQLKKQATRATTKESTKESGVESAKESTSSLLSSSSLISSDLSAPGGRAATSITSISQENQRIEGVSLASPNSSDEEAETRLALDEVLKIVVSKIPRVKTAGERREFLTMLAKEIRDAGYRPGEVPDAFVPSVATKLLPPVTPKSMTDDAYASWREDVLTEIRACVALEEFEIKSPATKASQGPRRTQLGDDIWQLLSLADETLDAPFTLYGPYHQYKRDKPADWFAQHEEKMKQHQLKHVAKEAAKRIRGLWPYLDTSERKQYAWLAPGRSEADIVADYKSGKWRDGAA